MSESELKKQAKLKLIEISKEIVEVFNKHDCTLDEVSAILGGLLAAFASQTEENYTFIVFMNAFSSTIIEIYRQQKEDEKINDSK